MTALELSIVLLNTGYMIQSNISSYNKPALIKLLFCLILFAYILLRALKLSITFDEATTWFFVNKFSYHNIIAYKGFDIANNHVINSLFIKATLDLFGKNILLIRSLNVICGIIYVLSVFGILKRVQSTWLQCFGAIMMCLQPFLLDYFTLARGYGVSISFMLLALYFTNEYLYTKSIKLLNISSFLSCLSAVSTFSFIYVVIFILLINIYCKVVHKFDKEEKNKFFIFLLPELICFSVIGLYIYPIGKMLAARPDTDGSSDGLLKSVFLPLLYANLGELREGSSLVTKLFKLPFIVAYAYVTFMFLVKRAGNIVIDKVNSMAFFIMFILIGAIFIIYIQFYVFNVKFPSDRTAIYIFVLLPLFVVLAADDLGNAVVRIVLFFVSLFIVFIFIFSINISHYQPGYADQFNEEIANIIYSKKFNGKVLFITDRNPLSFDFYNDKRRSDIEYVWLENESLVSYLSKNPINKMSEVYAYISDPEVYKGLAASKYFVVKQFQYPVFRNQSSSLLRLK